MSTDFLGQGWKFAITTDERGGIALSASEAKIKESILIILSTPKGERVMLIDYEDGSKRLACTYCGKSVSSPLPAGLPAPFLVRAVIECPECTEARPDYDALLRQCGEAVAILYHWILDNHRVSCILYLAEWAGARRVIKEIGRDAITALRDMGFLEVTGED